MISFAISIALLCFNPYPQYDRLFESIRLVETGGHPDPENAIGDGGVSRGPYQIGKAYWNDSGKFLPYRCVSNDYYARCVMIRYWKRYDSEAFYSGKMENLARIHNAGPRAMSLNRKHLTDTYWEKVQTHMRNSNG